MTPEELDPRISVPIVCGESQQGTASFYASGDATYLLTARHLALPTDATVPDGNGGHRWRVESDKTLLTIDVFLNADPWRHERIDLRSATVYSSETIDILVVEVEFDPREDGYTVFTADDLRRPADAPRTLRSVGWARDHRPPLTDTYSPTEHMQQFGSPHRVDLTNPIGDEEPDRYDGVYGYALAPLLADGIAYQGFSGAPIVAEGLVGIVSGGSLFSAPLPRAIQEETGLIPINYYGARMLAEVL